MSDTEESPRPHQPFDATIKELIRQGPLDWLRLVRLPGTVAIAIETDQTTITANVDKVLQVEYTPPYLAHFEMQTAYNRVPSSLQGKS